MIITCAPNAPDVGQSATLQVLKRDGADLVARFTVEGHPGITDCLPRASPWYMLSVHLLNGIQSAPR